MKRVLFVLVVAVVSTTAIMCRSASDVSYARTPELQNVVQVEASALAVVNRGIRADFDDSICPPEWPRRAWQMRGIRVVNPDPESRKATIGDLQLLREIVSRRADEAFKGGSAELQSVKVSGNTIEGHLTAPQGVGAVR